MGGLFIPYDGIGSHMPGGAPTYVSKGIWLANAFSATDAVVGEQHEIHVRVKNDEPAGGLTFDGIQVQVWVCKPASGAGPATVITNDLGNKLEFIMDISGPLGPESSAEAKDDWTPSVAELSLPNGGGHVCLAANVFAVAPFGSSSSSDGAKIISGATDPTSHPQHAQRNMHVHLVRPKAALESAGAAIPNPGEFDDIFFVTLVERSGEEAMTISDKLHLLTGRFAVLVDGDGQVQEVPTEPLGELPPDASPSLILDDNRRILLESGLTPGLALPDWDVHPPILISPDPIQDLDLWIDGARRLDPNGLPPGAVVVETPVIPAGELVMASPALLIPDQEPGRLHLFDLTQADSQGRVIGGMTIMTLTLPG